MIRRRQSDRDHLVRIGDREFLTRGLDQSFWTDAFHNSMSVSWPLFFGGFALYFLTMNLLFAFLFWLGGDCIANARSDSFVDLFFFSIETLATVGYGDMHPQNIYGHSIATMEIFTGMSTLAVFTGLIFARFSRPRARVIFADSMTFAQHDGQATLMARFANARRSSVNEARAELWFVYTDTTAEGVGFRRFRHLALKQPRNPIFVFSWTLFHEVDENSPIFGHGREQLEAMDAYFMVVFVGLDDVSGQNVNVRQGYSWRDVKFGEVFADILSVGENGVPQIDYRRLSATEPQETDGED
ncbi:potassium transporter [Rhodoblastus acidophilus]|uniref:Potassium transporter n=1 Tax=Candidatus Rhodoblastus alkanivorans TaxID=2954117 RepID=A0ABS9Z6U3_9HYPH|nr:ion channel [Candidatus Rhodoblastus alkanivorans]MCI4680281.1 potassium transporter [Candidatus Rhodoblastus alkanivorans]MCI4683100.1 potassium transporter [Candidatus Rhodoblastus alkanivorans]MDI4640411.1 potassium transporter [Rhodoblastus acidophilus]